MMMASELLLQSTERYALVVAMSANMTEDEGGVRVFRQSRQNIGASFAYITTSRYFLEI